MAQDLTEIYTKQKWIKDGEEINPNMALLLSEFEKYDTFVLQGGTRCFAPDQLVVTKHGSIPISEVKVGDMVKCFNEQTKLDEWKKVNEVLFFDNLKPTLKIELSNGNIIICSADHEFYNDGNWQQIIDIVSRKVRCSNIGEVKHWEVITNSKCPIVYDLSIQDNHNYYLDCDKHILVHNSGKTYAVIQYIWMLITQYSGLKIGIVRQSMPTLKGTVLLDFVKIGKDAELYSVANHNLTEQVYKTGGNEVHFFSADNEEKLRGRKLDVLYINEAPELTWDAVEQLFLRLEQKLIMDYNPSYPDSWIYENILSRDNVAFLRTTYKDNPFLKKRQLEELEWMRINNPAGFLVFGLGQRGEIQGQVYTHWRKIKEDAFPSNAPIFVIDFGFDPDPTCIIRGTIIGRTAYVKELVYELGLTAADMLIHLYFQGYRESMGHVLICDSAGTVLISEIRNGVKITDDDLFTRTANLGYEFKGQQQIVDLRRFVHEGATPLGIKKPAGSILNGIKLVKSKEVLVTENSKNAWSEYNKYKQRKDKHTGKFLAEPIDRDNHFCDTLRYLIMGEGRFY